VSAVTGCDVQSVNEIEYSLSTFGDRYLQRIYSHRELLECEQHAGPTATQLAMRFAAKEAVIKALQPTDHIPPWRMIEILWSKNSVPEVILHGEAQALALRNGLDRVMLSIGVSRGCAYAVVVADVVEDAVEA
jgi:holo-[acyl-carrier protein] synthase